MQAMIDELAKQAEESLGQVSSKETLATFWQEYLSKNGKIPALMKNLRSVAPEERPAMGKIINELKARVQAEYDAAADKVKQAELAARNAAETVDITLPAKTRTVGGLHPLTLVTNQIIDVFSGMGFAVAGIKQPAFWGLLATVVAPIPFVGTALVWGPLCLSLWFSGATMPAVGLALWGTLAVTSVDNILRPLFLQQGINAPFFVLIIAILCGLGSFGPMGLIIGPVLLAIAMQAVEEAHQTYHHTA